MTASTASHRVLHLPELLEKICLHLPQKELLLSQRISTAFRDTIQHSPKLQRALFFAPDWKLEARSFNAYAACNRPGRRPENNRLLLRAFPGCYPTITLVIINDNVYNTSARLEETADGAAAETGRRASEHWSWDVCVSFPADKAPLCNAAVLYPEASWRRMYLSQPPCTSLHLVRRWQRSSRAAMERAEGITMGAFVDEAGKAQPGWHRSYISSDRDWHFEGNIRCSAIEDQFHAKRSPSAKYLSTYAFSRSISNGSVRALSDEGDPARASEFARAALYVLGAGL